MMVKLARTYVVLVFAVEVLLFAATLLLHVNSWLQTGKTYTEFAEELFVVCFVAALGTAFLAADKDGLKRQFKSCPRWMRSVVVGLLVYAPIVAASSRLLLHNSESGLESLFTIAAIMLALEALSLSVLYAVLWTDCVQNQELVERSRNSFIAIVGLIAYLLARHAGYFAPQHRVEMP
jgi:hypothetical protein